MNESDKEEMVFDSCEATFIRNEGGGITIRQFEKRLGQDADIIIPLHHLDKFIAALKEAGKFFEERSE